MSKELKPMKGAHLVLNEQVLGFVRGALDDLTQPYSDELHDKDPKVLIEFLSGTGWTIAKDKFGTKAYKGMTYAVNGHEEGELRVGVVLRNGGLSLDIRPWGEY